MVARSGRRPQDEVESSGTKMVLAASALAEQSTALKEFLDKRPYVAISAPNGTCEAVHASTSRSLNAAAMKEMERREALRDLDRALQKLSLK